MTAPFRAKVRKSTSAEDRSTRSILLKVFTSRFRSSCSFKKVSSSIPSVQSTATSMSDLGVEEDRASEPKSMTMHFSGSRCFQITERISSFMSSTIL